MKCLRSIQIVHTPGDAILWVWYLIHNIPLKSNKSFGGVATLHKANFRISSNSSEIVADIFKRYDMTYKTDLT